MKKVRVLPLILALLMMATMAFAEGTDDPIVIKAGDIEVPLSKAQETYDYYIDQYIQLYAENSIVFTAEDADEVLLAVMELLEQNAILDGKVAEYGLGEITEQDKADLYAETEAYYNEQMVAYAASVGLTVEQAEELVAAEGITVDSLYESQLEYVPYNRLMEAILGDIEVTDEEIQAEYDAYVEADKDAFETDVATYEMYTNYYGAEDIYYTPTGYRYIKHILLAMPDDISAEMLDLETDMKAVQTAISTLDTELYALENVDEDAEEEPRTAEEIQADLDEQQAKYDALDAAYEQAREQILPSLKPILDEINAKLEAGEDFDAAIEAYNTDPGMLSTPEGYKVHKDSIVWDTTFRDTAMALAGVGDVAEPVLTQFGVHIIKYVGDVEGGGVPLSEALAESMRAEMLSTKQSTAYTEIFEQWLAETEIQSHPELIVVPELPTAEEAEKVVEAENQAGAKGTD